MTRKPSAARAIDGWLIVDKPLGMTSTEVVNRVKRVTGAQKVGHGGTLDPLATGVLPIAMGEATKTVSYVMDAAKAYRFTVSWGEARDTDDGEGAIVARSDLRPEDEAIAALLPRFSGAIMQRPPDYAAVKVHGERAYDLARRGERVELEARAVRVDRLQLIERPDADHAVFDMICGKGAYVRALARDMGELLGCYGFVAALRRMAVGPFRVEDAIPIQGLGDLVERETLSQATISVATALAGIPALAVTEPQALRLKSGQRIRISPKLFDEALVDGTTFKVMRGEELVALARLQDSEVSPVRVFNLRGDMHARV